MEPGTSCALGASITFLLRGWNRTDSSYPLAEVGEVGGKRAGEYLEGKRARGYNTGSFVIQAEEGLYYLDGYLMLGVC